MEQTITCIRCPVGCRLKVVTENGEVVSVSGNSCNRGIPYAKQECISPERMVTAVLRLTNRRMPVSVKTATPIPKGKIFRCMEELEALSLAAPIRMGQVVCPNVCGTGVDVVATKTVE